MINIIDEIEKSIFAISNKYSEPTSLVFSQSGLLMVESDINFPYVSNLLDSQRTRDEMFGLPYVIDFEMNRYFKAVFDKYSIDAKEYPFTQGYINWLLDYIEKELDKHQCWIGNEHIIPIAESWLKISDWDRNASLGDFVRVFIPNDEDIVFDV